MQQPEAYVGNAANLFDGHGNLANDSIEEFVTKFMQAYRKMEFETNTSDKR